MTHFARLALTSALLLAASGCGHVANGTLVADPQFAALDGNGDGKLSLDESRLASEAFDALDRNGDGFLDILEWMSTDATADNVARVQQTQDELNQNKNPQRNGTN